MLNRREALKRAGLIGVGGVALRTGSARAQGGRKPALTIALPSNPETIDPHQFRSVLTGSILINICETLLIRDPKSMELKPLLATSWRNVDPHTWEFKLRRGVKFHNGELFDAESVKFSIDRTIGSKLNTLGKVLWPPSIGQEVQIVDPGTVRITTRCRTRSCPTAWRRVGGMVPPKAMAEYREKFVSDRPIGTGPFRFVEYVVGERVVLEANPDYWGAKAASQRLVWQIVPDAATRVAALARGTIDVMLNLPVPLITTVRVTPSSPSTPSWARPCICCCSTCCRRRRSRIAGCAGAGLRDRSGHHREESLRGARQARQFRVARQVTNAIDPPAYAYDPHRAKKLLAEAGPGSGFDLTLWQATGRWSQAEEAAQLIAGYWEKIGVRVSLQTLEFGEYNRRAGRGLLKDAAYYAFINGTWDPSYLTQRFLPTYDPSATTTPPAS